VYEAFILVTLAGLVILAIRPGVKQGRPLIIHKAGLYHATLAPQLGRVQDLIGQIAGKFTATGDIASLQFKLHDSGGQYLLAAGFRGGMLYFQALPCKADSDCETLHKFSDEVLINIPLVESQQGGIAMRAAVEAAAMQLHIECQPLTNEGDACCLVP